MPLGLVMWLWMGIADGYDRWGRQKDNSFKVHGNGNVFVDRLFEALRMRLFLCLLVVCRAVDGGIYVMRVTCCDGIRCNVLYDALFFLLA